MIAWPDGVERSPAGPAREFVQPRVWSSSVWITTDGAAYRRYYNPVTRAWGAWEPLDAVLDDEQQRVGYALSGWTSSEACIATAWLHRRPGSRAHVRVLDPGAPDAHHLAWGEPEGDPD